MPKNIILCFDGTCNDPEDAIQHHTWSGNVEDDSITNILKLHLLFGGDLQGKNVFPDQMSFYYSGVGTYGSWFDKLINKTVAPPNKDVSTILKNAISDLFHHYEHGDRLFLFGFSRGAAIARRFASVLGTTFPALGKNAPMIDFMGVFDTVAAIKKPNLIKKELQPASDVVFENRTISPLIKEALHLLSMDDRRIAFFPTLMNRDERVTELWFAGAHSDVGGGYRYDGLSDTALECMLHELKRRNLGLQILTPADVACDTLCGEEKEPISYDDLLIQPNHLGKSHEQHAITHFKEAFLDYRSPRVSINDVPSVYPPIIHHTLFDRMADDPGYTPRPLFDRMINPYTEKTVNFCVWYNHERVVEYTSIDDARLAAAHIRSPLEINDSRTFTVQANQPYNPSRVLLRAGEKYRFEVNPDQLWFDADIPASPAGWDRSKIGKVKEWLIGFAESSRRCPDAEWFEIVGSLDRSDDDLFRILKHTDPAHPYSPTKDAELYAFANDLRDKYGNNLGSIEVTVTRIG